MPKPDSELPVIELDDDNENWLRIMRLEKIRARGWTGTLREWVDKFDDLGMDPLDCDPPIVR